MKPLSEVSITDWILAGVAVVGILLAIFQYRLTRQQTSILDRQTHIQEKQAELSQVDQRAQVGMPGVNGLPKLQAGTSPVILVTWLNTGKTPAKNCGGEMRLDVQAANAPFSPHYRLAGSSMSSSTIPPAASQNSPAALDHLLTEREIEAINEGTSILYLYGYTKYTDAFDDAHETGVACFYTPQFPGWRVVNDPRYNYAN